MTRSIIHFVHANSYPAGTHRLVLDPLRGHYTQAHACIRPEETLRGSVAAGLVTHPQGCALRFMREAETVAYHSLAHTPDALTRCGFPILVGFIGGADSVECRQAGLAATRRLVGRHCIRLSGGHLFPHGAAGRRRGGP